MRKLAKGFLLAISLISFSNTSFAACHGEAVACSDVDLNQCTVQKGCFVSPDGKSCQGVALACILILDEGACDKQADCRWIP